MSTEPGFDCPLCGRASLVRRGSRPIAALDCRRRMRVASEQENPMVAAILGACVDGSPKQALAESLMSEVLAARLVRAGEGRP